MIENYLIQVRREMSGKNRFRMIRTERNPKKREIPGEEGTKNRPGRSEDQNRETVEREKEEETEQEDKDMRAWIGEQPDQWKKGTIQKPLVNRNMLESSQKRKLNPRSCRPGSKQWQDASKQSSYQ
jgi:hypothetical protein